MAPFEQNQLALRDLDRHMGQMRQYEEDELIQGTVNEEVERQAQRDRQEIADLMRRINEMKADVSLMNIRDYEAAEQEADAQANAQRLKAMQQEQAVQPVYPELLLPGLPRAVRGVVGALDRLRSSRRAPPERQEPTFNLNSLMAP
jgi:Rps23 Pro-64 3,4-dihydroxylase Tpa1-like proline 4-hydroxylase